MSASIRMRSGRWFGGAAAVETGVGAAGAAGGDGSGGVIGCTYLMKEIVRLQSEPQPFSSRVRPTWYPSPRDRHAETHRPSRRAVCAFLNGPQHPPPHPA